MNKKLYWQVDSNADLSVTCPSLPECNSIIETDFASLDPSEQQEAQYTITPVWLTEEEYAKLPEA